MVKYFVIVFFSVLLFSCNKETDNPPVTPIDYGYFYLDTGRYLVYEIEEIEIDSALNYYDTVRYQIKMVYESTFADLEGNNAVRVERYKRNSEAASWAIKDVWQASLTTSTGELVEENIRFVKLIFPNELNKTWNGNVYNTMDSEEYEITSMDEPSTINGLSFDSVLTVTQLYDTTLLYKYYKAEKYAKGIGMIYKIDMDIESQNIAYPQVLVENRITSGTIYRQKIIDYGWE